MSSCHSFLCVCCVQRQRRVLAGEHLICRCPCRCIIGFESRQDYNGFAAVLIWVVSFMGGIVMVLPTPPCLVWFPVRTVPLSSADSPTHLPPRPPAHTHTTTVTPPLHIQHYQVNLLIGKQSFATCWLGARVRRQMCQLCTWPTQSSMEHFVVLAAAFSQYKFPHPLSPIHLTHPLHPPAVPTHRTHSLHPSTAPTHRIVPNAPRPVW